jgi:hypothetical protein
MTRVSCIRRMLPYAQLPEREKGKDRNSIRHYPDIAAHAGYRIVPIGLGSRAKVAPVPGGSLLARKSRYPLAARTEQLSLFDRIISRFAKLGNLRRKSSIRAVLAPALQRSEGGLCRYR